VFSKAFSSGYLTTATVFSNGWSDRRRGRQIGLLSRGLSLGYYGKVSSQLRYHRSLKETHNDIYSFSFYQKSQIADATNKLISQVSGTCLP